MFRSLLLYGIQPRPYFGAYVSRLNSEFELYSSASDMFFSDKTCCISVGGREALVERLVTSSFRKVTV